MREIKIVKRLAATLISFCMMIPSFTFTSVNAVSKVNKGINQNRLSESSEIINLEKNNVHAARIYYTDQDGNKYYIFDDDGFQYYVYPEYYYVIAKGYGVGVTGAINMNLFSGIRTFVESYPVREIGGDAFSNTQLSEIIIPDTVKYISDGSIMGGAFASTNLTTVTIPKNVEEIGSMAFNSCKKLETIYIYNPDCKINNPTLLKPQTTICNDNNCFTGVIYGYKNSTAQEYAKKCGYNFADIETKEVILTSVPTTTTKRTTTTTTTTTKRTTTSTTTTKRTTSTTTTSTTSTTTTKRTTTSTTTTTTTTTKRTTATTTTRKVTSTTPLSTTTPRLILGDVNNDGKLNAVDASRILFEYVRSSTSGERTFNYEQEIAADVDGNGRIDSCDASYVLLYYAYYCTNKLFNLQDIQSYKTDSPNVDVTLSLTQKKLTYDEARSSPIIEIILSAKSVNATKFDSTGIHIKIDSGLELVQTDYMRDPVWAVPQRRFFTSEAVQDGTDGLFLAFANDEPEVAKADGLNLWSFGVKVKNPEPGKKYPIQIAYSDGDLFDNCLSNDTEKLRENAFSHIEQGYIEIIDSPQTTTSKATTTTTKRVTTTSTTTFTTTTTMVSTTNKLDALKNTSYILTNGDQYTIPIDPSDLIFKSNNSEVAVVSKIGTITAIGNGDAIISIIDTESNVVQIKITVNPIGYTTSSTVTQPGITTTTTTTSQHSDYNLGDVNNDGMINAVDASSVLAYYAMISTNKDGGYNDNQKAAADVNHDGLINAVDASNILSYYAYISTTKEAVVSMEEYTNSNKSEKAYQDKLWEKAYQDKLQEFMNSDAFGTIEPNDSMFDLRDINGDNIPELFISVGTYHAATVHAYSFLNGEIIELFDGGEYGLLKYIPSESYLYENVSYAPGPDRSVDSLLKIYKYDGKTITKVIEFGDNIRGMNNYFTIDGTEVDKNKYDNEKEKYNLQSSISLGRNYLFNSDNINNIKYY